MKNLTWEDIKECERLKENSMNNIIHEEYFIYFPSSRRWFGMNDRIVDSYYSLEELKLMLLQQQLEKLK